MSAGRLGPVSGPAAILSSPVMQPGRRHSRGTRTLLVTAVLSLLVHLPLALWFVRATWLREIHAPPPSPISVSLLQAALPATPPEEEPEEETPPDEDGQIVEIAPPAIEKRPEEADYLSEYDSTVEEETVDPRFRVDRKVTAESFSPEDAFELEESEGVQTESPSTGVWAGRELFRRGELSLFPDRQSAWDFTDRGGIEAPAPVSHEHTRLAGSPSNDWLPEVDRADKTALNTHETLYASWWNRVKQLVSFFADQTLANARPTVPLRRPHYDLVLSGLIGADGSVTALEVTQASGVPEFDAAIKEAFALAAPFPEPPKGAVEADGFVHMDGFGFVIMIGAARAELTGIDPRQNVQFPGLETVPR